MKTKNKPLLKPAIMFYVVTIMCALSACQKTAKHDSPAPPKLVAVATGSPWTRMNNVPADSINDIEVFNNVIYAASGTSGKIYESTDGGASWSATNSAGAQVGISKITVFNGRIFAGNYYGSMYSSADNGNTWVNEGPLTEAVTSFVTWNNNLYCSSFDNGGKGVLMFNPLNNKWEPFPTSNLGNTRVSKVIAANNYLQAATSDFFASFNPAEKIWHTSDYVDITKSVYKNVRFPSYVIDMVYDQGSLLSQIYIGNDDRLSILRSDSGGATMYPDSVGLKSDKDVDKYIMRGLLTGTGKVYSITNQFKGGVGAWIQHRDRGAPAGTTWANNADFIPNLTANVIREFNGLLFLGTSKGLYFRKI